MSKDIPSDETLMEMSRQLDDFLFDLCEVNEMPFLQVASVVLARLGAIAMDIGEEPHLVRLLKLAELHLNAQQNTFNATPSDQIH